MSNYLNSCNSVAISNVYSARSWNLPGNVFGQAIGLALTVRIWIERRKQRQALANLSPHLLVDIGIDPGQAAHEAAKPFWEE